MGRSVSPILRREMQNLDKDSDTRRSAMQFLRSCAKDLNSEDISFFVAQIRDTEESGSQSDQYIISLFEPITRTNGAKIVPYIDDIMTAIVKTLASSSGSFPLQQACSKVVLTVARYAIEPTMPEERKRHIIHSLCAPLLSSLVGPQEHLSSGAALCLAALVAADNWRFASNDMVNKVCEIVAVALQEFSAHITSHMELVMALAKQNPLVVEAYARLLIQRALLALSESNSQTRLFAVRMISFLMKFLDPRSLSSQLEPIVEKMEQCQDDQISYVRHAAREALQIVKRIARHQGLKMGGYCDSPSGSQGGIVSPLFGDQSPTSMSDESQRPDSVTEYEPSYIESCMSMEYDHGSAKRDDLCFDNGGVDISLKDGLFSELARGSSCRGSCPPTPKQAKIRESEDDIIADFAGFHHSSSRGAAIARTPSPTPERSRSWVSAEDMDMFTTPRKLVRSLQYGNDEDDADSVHSEKQYTRTQSPCCCKSACTPNPGSNKKACLHVDFETSGNEVCDIEMEKTGITTESVSSTDDILVDTEVQTSANVITSHKATGSQCGFGGCRRASFWVIGCILFALLAVVISVLGIGGGNQEPRLVPT